MSLAVYQNMKWPPYKYEPYPRWVTKKDGTQALAQNQQEEVKIIATDTTDGPELTAESIQLKQDNDVLLRELAKIRMEQAEMQAEMAKFVEAQKKAETGKKLEASKNAPAQAAPAAKPVSIEDLAKM